MERMENIIKETKQILTSLLISTPMTLTIRALNSDFENMTGYPIPFREMGYNSLIHFLSSISDVLVVCGQEVKPVVTKKSAHVNELVTKQKVNTPKRSGRFRPRHYNNPRIHMNVNTVTRSFGNLSPFPRAFPSSRGGGVTPARRQNSSPNCANLISARPPLNPALSQANRSREVTENNNFAPTVQSQTLVTNGDISPISLPPRSASRSLKATCSTPESVRCDSPKSPLSVTNVISKCQTTTRPSLEGVTFHFKSGQEGDTVEHQFSLSQEKNDSKIPLTIQNNFKKLINEFPEGIWCMKLPVEYKKRFGHELHYEDFGYKSLAGMCAQLTEIFHCVREASDDYKLYDRKKPLPESALKEDNSNTSDRFDNGMHTSNSSIFPIDWGNFCIPENVFVPGDDIPQSFMSKEDYETENNVFEIIVTDIYDLSKFWIYFKSSHGPLNRLMDDMQGFYAKNCDAYRIPVSLLEIHLFCVANYLNEYHRVVIVNLMGLEQGFVKVYCIDYGTVCKISKNELWYLTKEFGEFPQQAIRTRLAEIWPPTENTTWSRESAVRFKNLITNRRIFAKVVSVDWDKKILQAYLADTSIEPVKYINEILVEEGYASYTNQERKKSIKSSVCVPIVQYLHLFPSFEEIEYAIVPSSLEMNDFVNYDVSVDFCYPQYFKKASDAHMVKEIEEHVERSNNQLKDVLIQTTIHHKEIKAKRIKSSELTRCCLGKMYDIIRDATFKENNLELASAYDSKPKLKPEFGSVMSPFRVKAEVVTVIPTEDEYNNFLNKLMKKKIQQETIEEEREASKYLCTNPFIDDDSLSPNLEKYSSTNPFLCDLDEETITENNINLNTPNNINQSTFNINNLQKDLNKINNISQTVKNTNMIKQEPFTVMPSHNDKIPDLKYPQKSQNGDYLKTDLQNYNYPTHASNHNKISTTQAWSDHAQDFFEEEYEDVSERNDYLAWSEHDGSELNPCADDYTPHTNWSTQDNENYPEIEETPQLSEIQESPQFSEIQKASQFVNSKTNHAGTKKWPVVFENDSIVEEPDDTKGLISSEDSSKSDDSSDEELVQESLLRLKKLLQSPGSTAGEESSVISDSFEYLELDSSTQYLDQKKLCSYQRGKNLFDDEDDEVQQTSDQGSQTQNDSDQGSEESQVPDHNSEPAYMVLDQHSERECMVPEQISDPKYMVPRSISEPRYMVPDQSSETAYKVPDQISEPKCMVPHRNSELTNMVPDKISETAYMVPDHDSEPPFVVPDQDSDSAYVVEEPIETVDRIDTPEMEPFVFSSQPVRVDAPVFVPPQQMEPVRVTSSVPPGFRSLTGAPLHAQNMQQPPPWGMPPCGPQGMPLVNGYPPGFPPGFNNFNMPRPMGAMQQHVFYPPNPNQPIFVFNCGPMPFNSTSEFFAGFNAFLRNNSMPFQNYPGGGDIPK